ncbi:S-adenosylmethionine:tRNA ribosyltransferase-isomerase [Imperialibacter roseus]|uniref:S-adenosylmethionine:tRNA ribosyltransferase-isomerase n=1 Tax=Imperialibacter roseus TaxID=1324217 RepID=A0ABZ0IJG4_9BACT|nr:S-adenosylmethionine:tRNA ribosyltransferase-isomerase [Imperialibacter roseus]WOK04691.1 S-adenosylmethionine:tRNA ribosyltransferase-isomerase [Imperialibacter roseus]
MPPQINVSEYTYDLPDERIAKFPLEDRSASKLLFYNKGTIEHLRFKSIPSLLPENTSLYFNNTKVIPARLAFQKYTGALIEIFLLQPILPSPVISVAMEARSPVVWKCMIGNAKRWKEGVLERNIELEGATLKVEVKRLGTNEVQLSWNKSAARFVDVVDAIGKTPLPPYLHREAIENDKKTYQTVYSKKDGAVAAPTAGLHFTGEVIQQLRDKGVATNFLTLHVSAGTFQPIKTATAEEHAMHSEQIIIKRENLEQLLTPGRFNVAVGTTSMRTLESTYWYGTMLGRNSVAEFKIPKLLPYEQQASLPSPKESIMNILNRMDALGVDELTGTTEIFIFPGYQFRVVNGLITNFHQPNSTLILLVAAFVGDDWRKVYNEALASDYRFLSYGDSSLLIPWK